jgi:hypothetical protein
MVEGSNEKTLAFIILFSISCLSLVMVTAYINYSHPTIAPPRLAWLYMRSCSAERNDTGLYVAFDLQNKGTASGTLDIFFLNEIPQQNITGLSIILNGTTLDKANSLRYTLHPWDSITANLILPNDNEYITGENLKIMIQTLGAGLWLYPKVAIK